MHKKILKRFDSLEKSKFGEEYNISKNHLHYLILNKKDFLNLKFSILGLLANLILLKLSLISILICKIKRIKIANYFIVFPKSLGKYDNRSSYILKNFDLNNSLNIIRCVSFIDSICAYFKYPNVIFYLSFQYFNQSFFSKKVSFIEKYKMLHKTEKKNFLTTKKIFKFLKIKRFISIDDQRVIQMFLEVCKVLQISSFGYMHYKFSRFVVGIKYLCFDHFFVWSKYFKRKLIDVNKNYKYKKIFITGYPKKKINSLKQNKISLLYLVDLNLNFNEIKKIIKKIIYNKNIKLFIKLKPQLNINKKWITFCNDNKIKCFSDENLNYINFKYNIDYFIATISTAVLESTLYKAMPIKLITKNDFADDLLKDKVVQKASNLRDILNIVKKKPSKKKINSIFVKVWGKKKYSSNNIKKILLNHIYI
jgi:hypothetical protein